MYEYIRNTANTVTRILTRDDMERVWLDAAADGSVMHPYARREVGTDNTRPYCATDGCGVPYNAEGWAPVTLVDVPETEPLPPLEAWEDGLDDPDQVRAEIWQAADAAADAANACGEYEQTAAWPNGHTGRPGREQGDDEECRGEGEVTFRRTITRTMVVTQEVTIHVEAGDDPYDTLANEYPAWDDIDEYTDNEEEGYEGPELYDDDREYRPAEPAEPPALAVLIQRALDYNDTWRTIKAAILTVAQRHGAPVTERPGVAISALVFDIDDSTTDDSGTTRYAAHNVRLAHVACDEYERRIMMGNDAGERERYARYAIQRTVPELDGHTIRATALVINDATQWGPTD